MEPGTTTGMFELAAVRAEVETLEARRRERRRTLRVAAACAVGGGVVDVAAVGLAAWAPIAIRLGFVALALAVAARLSRTSARGMERLTLLVSLALAATWTGIVATTGGASSPERHFTHALVLALVILAPDHLATVVAGALATVGGVALVLLAGGAGGAELGVFVGSGLCATALAVYGGARFGAVRAAELAAERGRAAAVEELARSERGRARSERLAVVGRLAAGVAHEINNPLAFVKANLGWLDGELRDGRPPDAGETREVLAETLSGVERIRAIVGDLRAFAREERDEVQPHPVRELVDEATRLASVRLRGLARVERLVPEDLPPVLANRQRLVQVMVNLLVNAADALEERGGPGRIVVQAERSGDHVRLSVTDDGPGIPREVLGRIFEPFVTTKPPGKGTGLGLAVSREYVQRGGGSLEAGNVPGGGARFTVQLPRGA